jgi:hypothetical protein
MAVTADEKSKVRKSLAQESAQKRNQILSTMESFADWLEVAARIYVAATSLAPLFAWVCSLFL